MIGPLAVVLTALALSSRARAAPRRPTRPQPRPRPKPQPTPPRPTRPPPRRPQPKPEPTPKPPPAYEPEPTLPAPAPPPTSAPEPSDDERAVIDIGPPERVTEEEYARRVRETLDEAPAPQVEKQAAVTAAKRAKSAAEQAPRSIPSPEPEPQPTPQPSLAERTAQPVADHLREHGAHDYNRQLLSRWQREAGIVVDGLYGAQTRQALIEHGATDPKPPQPFVGQKAPAQPTRSAAARSAQQVANHLSNKGRANYSRQLVRDWQRAAGIVADGLYGAQTRQALIEHGASNVPPPFFGQTAPQPTPSSSSSSSSDVPEGYDPAAARRHAQTMADHLRSKGRAHYSRSLMRKWQRFAGVSADGLYGGSSRGALLHHGANDVPPSFFSPTRTVPYVPPEER